jgi:hypothetical protein
VPSDYEEGVLIGVLVGEGHFGGDGRQPQVTLRMHERHSALFHWIERTFPGGRLYGPYDHGGRRYYQWMARGTFLRDELLPILLRRITPTLDGYTHTRVSEMCDRYAGQLAADPQLAADHQLTSPVPAPQPNPASISSTPSARDAPSEPQGPRASTLSTGSTHRARSRPGSS